MRNSDLKPKRCAIYTRKSSEEGLEQEFNSLHAQRDACEAYIRSQAGEGWIASKAKYDDGGISGGTMDRPGLKSLLADIEAGLVDIVVVYKVDRLTRSLADFAKIIEVFDRQGASFVAVTQQFNTTSSMGRLTLNILLSFAQFEREVTGERIRDKIAASKRQGMWMGGLEPLGYKGHGRTLVIESEEAETVRTIFRLYNDLGSVRRLDAELRKRGVISRVRTKADGQTIGGVPMSKGSLYAMLSNPIYIGQIRHKNICHAGLHEAVIEPGLWAATQALLDRNRQGNKDRRTSSNGAPLLGKLFDEKGERLVPTYTIKKARRYRYYISHVLLNPRGDVKEAGLRLPATALETTVMSTITSLLHDHALLATAWHYAGLPMEQYRSIVSALAAKPVLEPLSIVERVEVSPADLAITISFEPIVKGSPTLMHRVPMTTRRRGRETRLVLDNEKRQVDPSLLMAIARGHTWFEELARDADIGMAEIAQRDGASKGRVSQITKLAFLSPKIVQAVIDGRQPIGLTTKALLDLDPLPLLWAEQEALLGV
jgi:DNA invertase Pin-like site-specific DNA recombinase